MKTLLLALVLIAPIQARASKILYNLGGEQRLVDVGQGGGVTADATVVWDERQDGSYPAGAPTGYAERWTEQVQAVDGAGNPRFDPLLDANGKIVVDDKGNPVPSTTPTMVTIAHLRENAAMKTAKAARDAAQAAADSQASADEASLSALAVKIRAKTATAADVRDALGIALKKLGK